MADRRARLLNLDRVDELLLARRWSWAKLAAESGVGYRTIRYALDPDEPRAIRRQNAQKIAAALKSNLDDISTPRRQPVDA